MPNAKLVINAIGKEPREIEISDGITTIGRTSENTVSFAGEQSISRYHAEIEVRDDEFWLFELGSSNGTTVNGETVTTERRLQNCDLINFGGNSEVEFLIQKSASEENAEPEAPQIENPEAPKIEAEIPAETPEAKSGFPIMLILASVLVGIAIVSVVVVGLIFLLPSNKTEPPQNTQIASAGNPIQSDDDSPPEDDPDVTPTPEIQATQDVNQDDAVTTTPIPKVEKQVQLGDVKTISDDFVKKLPGTALYKFDPEFLRLVQAKTAEYKSEGFYARASQGQIVDAINVAYNLEQGVNVRLAYYLAMSRSKFELKKQPDGEGLWRMSNEFVAANGYNGQCGTETLSDSAQNCAAKASSIYVKALIGTLFEGDVVYGVACFGLPLAEAGDFKAKLPPDRKDFWKIIKSMPKQRNEVINFFAAGIVAENPQKFGLKRDKPLSTLFPK